MIWSKKTDHVGFNEALSKWNTIAHPGYFINFGYPGIIEKGQELQELMLKGQASITIPENPWIRWPCVHICLEHVQGPRRPGLILNSAVSFSKLSWFGDWMLWTPNTWQSILLSLSEIKRKEGLGGWERGHEYNTATLCSGPGKRLGDHFCH